MRDREDDNTTRPSNAFTREFLDNLNQHDEPLTAAQADTAGPWIVVPIPSPGWAVLRQGESLAAGDQPTAVFRERARALLTAAVLPGTGFGRRFRLEAMRTSEGFAVTTGGEIVGHLSYFNQELVAALQTVEALARLPESIARFLLASGAVALERAGRILAHEEPPA
jgi:hypothetical protein